MVKVTGGGRGMKAIATRMRYISKNGRLTIEDEQGRKVHGRDALREIEDDWRFGGSRIADTSPRREAFNIVRCGARAWQFRRAPAELLRFFLQTWRTVQLALALSAKYTPKMRGRTEQ
jgi:hypothetical protein